MKKPTKKTFILEMVFKSPKAPDFGKGRGVLATQEITLKDAFGYGFDDNPMLIRAKMELEERLTRAMVEFRWVEKKKKK